MLRWLLRRYFWQLVYFSESREIEYNLVTGAYRHRSIDKAGTKFHEGPWVHGLPECTNLDDLMTPVEMAGRLSPLKRDKAGNLVKKDNDNA